MYIWMILATFIVMLAAFNLSPRADLQRQQDTPLAEAAITKFLVQHDAAVKYAKAQLLLKHNNPSSSYGITSGAISVCNASGTGKLCEFLPIGYKYEEKLYYSTIYCLNAETYKKDESGKTVLDKHEGVEAVTNCNDSGHNAIYVITYGRVPQRWKNVSTNRILPDYYNAMHNRVAVGASCGIVVPKEEGDNRVNSNGKPRNRLESDFVIEGVDTQNTSIPPYFLENDKTFKTQCLSSDGKKINSTYPCIIFVNQL